MFLRFNTRKKTARSIAPGASSKTVACGGGAIIFSYKPDGTRNWARYGLAFEDNAGVDPGSESDIYDKTPRYHFDYKNWSKGNRIADWVTSDTAYAWPLDENGNMIHGKAHEAVSLEMEGDYLFIAYFGMIDIGSVRVHRVSDGQFVGMLLFDEMLSGAKFDLLVNSTSMPSHYPVNKKSTASPAERVV